MAWVSKELKNKIAAALKEADLPFKFTVAGANSHSLIVTITEAPKSFLTDYIGTNVDLTDGYMQVNTHYVDKAFEGDTLVALEKMITIIKTAGDWFDKSDSMSDYFHTAFYIDVNIGRFNKPCRFVKTPQSLSKSLDFLMNRKEDGEGNPVALAAVTNPVALAADRMGNTPVGKMLSREALMELAAAALGEI